MRLRIAAALIVLASPWIAAGAYACEAHEAAARAAALRELGRWTWDPLTVPLLALSAGTYALGLLRLWRSAGVGHGVRAIEACAFALGLCVAVAALLSPLDAISDALFSMHMVQHELLMLIAAPLLVAGKPWLTAMWALPLAVRRRGLALVSSPSARGPLRALAHPILVLGVHAAILWIWHMPALFEAALASELVHGVQHFTFFASAALFFYALMHGRYGRGGYGAAVLFVFVTALHSSLLGALITFVRRGLYPTHAARTALLAHDPLEDQQLAGLIMWVPACTALMAVGLALFGAWLGEAERRAARRRGAA